MLLSDGDMTLLIVEDEALIGLYLCDLLEQANFRILGPAKTVEQAMLLIRRHEPQVTVIEACLKTGSCADIAHELHSRRIPFVVQSAYRQQPESKAMFYDAPWLSKPVSERDLIVALTALLEPVAP